MPQDDQGFPGYGDGVHELVIEARGLTKRFGKVLALDHLDLEVPAGTCLGLVGERGAGKSVAIRLLAGLARPTSGVVTLAGVRLNSRGGLAGRAKLGVLDQEPSLYDWMTGRELLAFTGDLLGIARSEAPARIEATLGRLGLADAADRRVEEYSLPLRQRLGLAQALVGSPRVLLLDEPTSALDPAGRRTVRELLEELRARGHAVLLNSHLLSEVELVCDRVAIISRGRLVAEGSPAELSRPRGVEVETASAVRLFEGATREDAPAIVARLVAEGEHVYGVRVLATTLEDVYLEAVGE